MQQFFSRKYRTYFLDRFASGSWNLVSSQPGKKLVWCHGASVGEIGGVTPIISRLQDSDLPTSIIVSTTSVAGKEEAQKKKWCEIAALLPLDHPMLMRRLIRRLQPDICVIVETEIWPSMLLELHRANVPVVLVNGRISDYSYPRYRKIKWVMRRALDCINSILVQAERDKQRFISLGADKDKVCIAGSTKYDKPVRSIKESDRDSLAKEMGISVDQPCFVAGSVRAGEDEIVIKGYLLAKKQNPKLQMIIAPRHVAKFSVVADLLKKYKIDFNRRTNGEAKESKSVLLLDTIGELSSAYSLASVSFVGGSLVNIGGHNPLEPASYGSPVIVGPYTSNVQDAVSDLEGVEALFVVKDEVELAEELAVLLDDIELCREKGKNAHRVWTANLGATEYVSREIVSFLV